LADADSIRVDGERRLGGRVQEGGLLTFCTSTRDGDDLAGQIADTEAFLGAHFKELERLIRRKDVDDATLDFAIDIRVDGTRVAFQFDRFPRSLVSLAARLGLAIEVSLYPQ
jgi:hypothetical protein